MVGAPLSFISGKTNGLPAREELWGWLILFIASIQGDYFVYIDFLHPISSILLNGPMGWWRFNR